MPPITYNADGSTSQVSSSNNTVTVRASVPGKASSAPATGFPLKVEQIQNVNTKYGLPDKSVLMFDKNTGMWNPVEYNPGATTAMRFDFIDSLEWVVHHNMNTRTFKKSLILSDGTEFSAKTKIIDENTFVVYLTSAESGWVDVIFGV